MAMPVVAIVGRPNVGKSTLFNKLIGKRLSIVDDTPGVTRDRVLSPCEWLGNSFWVVDTGGIEMEAKDGIMLEMRRQAMLAIESAQVIVLVTDLHSGVTAADQAVADLLQKSGKPVILCVNKCDRVGNLPLEYYEFYNLGLSEPIGVSALHGHGTGDLLDEICKHLSFSKSEEEEDAIHVAVVGRPNAGKSSLINKMVGEERVIVSDVAGTTRDAVDTVMHTENQSYVWIDTAGIRRKSKVLENVERYSVMRAHMAMERADVAVILVDGSEGAAEQDTKIAGYAHELGKPSIIAVNKWDLVEKDTHTMNKFTKEIKEKFGFMRYAPVVFLSAKTGQRFPQLLNEIKHVYEQNHRRISTGALNDMLAFSVSRVEPPSDKGKRLKIYYMTQASTVPPTFACFVNDPELFHFSYQRYLENQVRQTFSLQGTPIRLLVRERKGKKN